MLAKYKYADYTDKYLNNNLTNIREMLKTNKYTNYTE